MYGVFKAHITIGNYEFKQVNDVNIVRSVDMLSDTATIKMPTTFLLKSSENTITKKKIDEAIKVGDKVSISVGYDGIIFKEEFTGYVKKIKPNTPMEIECEDAVYLIRKKTINKMFINAELVDVLEHIVAGTGVELSDVIPSLKLERFLIANINGAAALDKIKEEFGLAIYIDDDGKLFAGLKQQLNTVQKVVYHFQKNVITASTNLEFVKEEDVKIKIKAIGIAADNTRTEIEVGDVDGELRTLHFYHISDKDKLKEIAESKRKELTYTGYRGNLTSFLFPEADRGWAAEVADGNYPEKAGVYFIEKMEVNFNDAGGRRILTLGSKL